jgi:hypothetical protein
LCGDRRWRFRRPLARPRSGRREAPDGDSAGGRASPQGRSDGSKRRTGAAAPARNLHGLAACCQTRGRGNERGRAGFVGECGGGEVGGTWPGWVRGAGGSGRRLGMTDGWDPLSREERGEGARG